METFPLGVNNSHQIMIFWFTFGSYFKCPSTIFYTHIVLQGIEKPHIVFFVNFIFIISLITNDLAWCRSVYSHWQNPYVEHHHFFPSPSSRQDSSQFASSLQYSAETKHIYSNVGKKNWYEMKFTSNGGKHNHQKYCQHFEIHFWSRSIDVNFKLTVLVLIKVKLI